MINIMFTINYKLFACLFVVIVIATQITHYKAEEVVDKDNIEEAAESYEKYKLYKVIPSTENQLNALYNLSIGNENYDIWRMSKIVNSVSEIMVPPDSQLNFESTMRQLDINYTEIINNIAKVLQVDTSKIQTRFLRQVDFDSYYRVSEIDSFLDDLAYRYPDLVTVQIIGRSYENKDIKTITISQKSSQSKKKIFIDAGIHAREWIAPATALYIIKELVENSATNSEVLNTFDWVILPVVNPDGYEYSHTKNRLWRKSRKPTGTRGCFGTDLNRNFGFHWGEVGASNKGCSHTYKGNKAFSEQEARVIRDLMHSFDGTCAFYLTLHSFGNYFLYPWGYTSKLPENWKDMHQIALAGANAIRHYTGTKYTIGSSTNVLYAAAGGSDDYAIARGGIPYAITMELPGGGEHGFDPPPSRIKSIVEESWIGIKAMAKQYKLYKIKPINRMQLDVLHHFIVENKDLDVWTMPKIIGKHTEIAAPPNYQKSFELLLNNYNITYHVIIDNIAKTLLNTEVTGVKQARMWWGSDYMSYLKLDQIYDHMKKLAERFPDLVTIQSIGNSYENREIRMMTISRNNSMLKKKILIDAGIHAREWIAPSTAMFVMDQLLKESKDCSDLLEKFDWMIIPVANPDGYEYSHGWIQRRLWRKTRRPTGFGWCTGSDINRNFDFHWGAIGASVFPCSETYKGPHAFSEPEAVALKNLMHSLNGSCAFYLTLHSYGKLLLYPWGYTSELPKNAKDLHALAAAGAKAIFDATGTGYTVGSSTNVLYAAAGGSDDYAMAKAAIKYAITMELPGGGMFGFNPPVYSIKGLVEESWLGIKAMAKKLEELLNDEVILLN